MPAPESALTLDRLLGETRARREELHSFIERVREDRRLWAQHAEALTRRMRLTAPQRQLFRAHLSRFRSRRHT